jgi:hypothetical protein
MSPTSTAAAPGARAPHRAARAVALVRCMRHDLVAHLAHRLDTPPAGLVPATHPKEQ